MPCVLGWAALHTDLDHLLFTVFLWHLLTEQGFCCIFGYLPAWPSGVKMQAKRLAQLNRFSPQDIYSF
jgi:hypothetical protein